MRISTHLAIYCLPLSLLAGCMVSPTFLKQNGQPAIPSVNATTEEAGGITSAALLPSTKETQVVTAGSSSALAGTAVSFPPGSLAVATSITISAGEQLANDAVTTQLNLGTTVNAAAQPVQILSSVTTDAAKPFTIALPLPSGTSLALDGSFPNLIILFHVKHAVDGNTDFTGIITRDQISVVNGQAQIATLYFGTYQAVYTAQPVVQQVSVAAAPSAVGTDAQISRNVYFFAGAAGASFGTGPASGGLQGWVPTMNSSTVAAGATLSNAVISTVVYGD